MKNKKIIITAVLLVISAWNCFRITSCSNIRAVEFLSIFVSGALAGVLLTQIFKAIKDRKK
ncbi:MAG: hypothetical protein PHD97_04645 [Bacteroidales bacterium]|nr:hypothetical protein [Bacteroidales bacterium]